MPFQHVVMVVLANLIFLSPGSMKCWEATDLLVDYAKFFNIQANQATCELSLEDSLKYGYNEQINHIVTEYWIGNESYYVDPTAWNDWYSTNISIRFRCLNEGQYNWVGHWK